MVSVRLLRIALTACLLMMGSHAFAAPVRCSYGYQDSTCTPAIVAAPQPQPTCPAGYTQTQAPYWGGSAWMGLSCSPPPPPPPVLPPVLPPSTPGDEKNACAALWGVPASSLTGPLTGAGKDQYNAIIGRFTAMGYYWNGIDVTWGTPGSPATNDMFYPSGEYPTTDFCWVQPGTTTVTGTETYGFCSPNGGSASCGGGGVGN